MDFYHLLKILVKNYAASILKIFLIVLKNIDRCNKNSFKKSNLKIAKVTGHLIGNKFDDKITSASKKFLQNAFKTDENETKISKERYISPEERQKNY